VSQARGSTSSHPERKLISLPITHTRLALLVVYNGRVTSGRGC
jgi:hypothetical protein